MGNKTTPRALNGAVSDSEREGTRERSKTTQGEIKAVAGARRAIQKRKARENKSQETNARALLYPLFAPPVLLITRAWQCLLRLRRSQRWSCARRTAHLPPPSAKSGSSEPGPAPAPLWGSGGCPSACSPPWSSLARYWRGSPVVLVVSIVIAILVSIVSRRRCCRLGRVVVSHTRSIWHNKGGVLARGRSQEAPVKH